jgi:hypothetical protein
VTRIARRLGFAVAALVAFAITGTAVAGGASAAPVTDPTAAAAGWLVQNYANATCTVAPDGDHAVTFYGADCYQAPGFTIDSIFALAAAKAGGAKLDRVAAYLEAALPSYTGTDPKNIYGISTGSAAKALLAFQVLDSRPAVQTGLLELVNANICTQVAPDCGAPGAARNIYSGISQSFVVLALARAHSDDNIDATVDYLLGSTQCDDGGFTSLLPAKLPPPTPCASNIDATAYALSALQAAESRVTGADRLAAVEGAAKSAVGYLLSTQAADGSWGSNVGSTGIAVSALSATAAPAAVAAVQRGQAWLKAQQAGCTAGPGLVGSVQFGEGDPFKSTSDALLGLAGESLATLAAKGAAALAPAQDCTVATTPSAEPSPAVAVDSTTAAVDAVVAAPQPQLAATGSTDRGLALLGSVLLLLGIAAVAFTRSPGEARGHR